MANLLTAGGPAEVALTDITKDSMRAAFAAYAATHEPASIRRCWSTWNVLCDFLYTAELIPANPMPFVGRPKAAKTLPRSLPQPAVAALLDVVGRDHASPRRTDWPGVAAEVSSADSGVHAAAVSRAGSAVAGGSSLVKRLGTSPSVTDKRWIIALIHQMCCKPMRNSHFALPTARGSSVTVGKRGKGWKLPCDGGNPI